MTANGSIVFPFAKKYILSMGVSLQENPLEIKLKGIIKIKGGCAKNMVIEEHETKIIKTLYDRGKVMDGKVAYDTTAYDTAEVLSQTGLSQDSAKHALQNLVDFEFIELDGKTIRLLPSGKRYCLHVFH